MGDAKSEVATHLDLTLLRYSKVWEDHAILSTALDVQPDDVVLSVGSAGDNALNLLLHGPSRLVVLDFSAMQNALLQLKLAAIRELSHADLLLLLGLHGTGERRLSLLEQLKSLPEDARALLRSTEEAVKDGLMDSGRFDRYMKDIGVNIFRCVGEGRVRAAFNAETLEEQLGLVSQWPLDELRTLAAKAFDAREQAKRGRDAAQLAHVKLDSNTVGDIMASRIINALRSVHLKDSIYMRWFMLGSPTSEEVAACLAGDRATEVAVLPPYLHQRSFPALQRLVDCVEVHTCSIEAFLDTGRLFNKANLSDIFEYMSQESSDKLFESLAAICKPNGRLAFWNLYLDRRPTPEGKPPCFQRLAALSEKLSPISIAWGSSCFLGDLSSCPCLRQQRMTLSLFVLPV